MQVNQLLMASGDDPLRRLTEVAALSHGVDRAYQNNGATIVAPRSDSNFADGMNGPSNSSTSPTLLSAGLSGSTAGGFEIALLHKPRNNKGAYAMLTEGDELRVTPGVGKCLRIRVVSRLPFSTNDIQVALEPTFNEKHPFQLDDCNVSTNGDTFLGEVDVRLFILSHTRSFRFCVHIDTRTGQRLSARTISLTSRNNGKSKKQQAAAAALQQQHLVQHVKSPGNSSSGSASPVHSGSITKSPPRSPHTTSGSAVMISQLPHSSQQVASSSSARTLSSEVAPSPNAPFFTSSSSSLHQDLSAHPSKKMRLDATGLMTLSNGSLNQLLPSLNDLNNNHTNNNNNNAALANAGSSLMMLGSAAAVANNTNTNSMNSMNSLSNLSLNSSGGFHSSGSNINMFGPGARVLSTHGTAAIAPSPLHTPPLHQSSPATTINSNAAILAESDRVRVLEQRVWSLEEMLRYNNQRLFEEQQLWQKRLVETEQRARLAEEELVRYRNAWNQQQHQIALAQQMQMQQQLQQQQMQLQQAHIAQQQQQLQQQVPQLQSQPQPQSQPQQIQQIQPQSAAPTTQVPVKAESSESSATSQVTNNDSTLSTTRP